MPALFRLASEIGIRHIVVIGFIVQHVQLFETVGSRSNIRTRCHEEAFGIRFEMRLDFKARISTNRIDRSRLN